VGVSDRTVYFVRARDVCTSTAERPERLADPGADASTAERPRLVIPPSVYDP
jgi:hypothetical protein